MSSNVTVDTFKAIRCPRISKSITEGINSLELQDVPRVKQLKPHELRIQVYASCVNYFDLLITIGTYQHKPQMPYTMGSECSGKIIECGNKVSMYKIGDSVIIPMGGQCMAAEVVVDERIVIRKPDTLSYTQSAAIGVGFMTGYHALVHRGRIQQGDYLLVTGAGGGMGLAAVQLGRALGAIVIGAASSDEKCRIAAQYGAHHTINYSTGKFKDQIEKITQKKLIQVCYDPVGGDIFTECIRCMAPNGRLLIIGFASGNIPNIKANMVLVKGFDVVGVRSGAEMMRDPSIAADMAQRLIELTSVEHLENGGWDIAPVVSQSYFWLTDDWKNAWRLVNQRQIIGKAAVKWHADADKIPEVRKNIKTNSKM